MAVKIHLQNRTVSLAVRDLVAEPMGPWLPLGAALGAPRRLSLARHAHRHHQHARSATYRREFTVRQHFRVDDFDVRLHGRIDGLQPLDGGAWLIEEIKTVILPPLAWAALSADSHPAHIEQLGIYGHLIEHTGQPVTGRLLYVNLADGATRSFDVTGPFAHYGPIIVARIRALLTDAFEREHRRAERRQRAAALVFPHPQPRRHQDRLIEAVRQAVAAGRHLLVSAPSGIGKTVGTLWPALQEALAHDRRVLFVTAKNTQHAQAADTVRRLAAATGVVIQAREKMCINSVYACREEFCPHLQGLAVRLQQPGLAARLADNRVVEPTTAIETGRRTGICPFELATHLAKQLDVVVCDYNYVFDPQVSVRGWFANDNAADAILIIDEAHNLAERARDYYSPSLSRQQLHNVGRQLRHVSPALARQIRHLLRVIDDFLAGQHAASPDEYSQLDDRPPPAAGAAVGLVESPRLFFEQLQPEIDRLAVRYFLDKVESGRPLAEDPLEDFFAELDRFHNVLALAGEEFVYLADGQSLKVLCRDASRMLAERLNSFHSVVAMSATLEPMDFYQTLLGFDPRRTDQLSLPSPFPPEHRKVLVYPALSTAFRHRDANHPQIAAVIATTVAARPGNYLALFPSYEFLRATARHLAVPFLAQQPGMTDAERAALLAALRSNEPPRLVLAVQGGVFAEGVDYPGEMLSGVIVISPALPQVSVERELMRQYYQERYGRGFEFAYLYPGMNRVIQSVGRLIRSETDVGVAVLVCQRFAQDQYARLFPPDWTAATDSLVTRDLAGDLAAFWRRVSAPR
jgi:DNA excision repair protein ERCC-2